MIGSSTNRSLNDNKLKRNSRCATKTLGIILMLSLILFAIYIGWGLTAKNVGFFLPRRLMKLGAVILVSYCIGYSAVAFQTITNNRILTPSVLGLDSLYLFLQTFIVFFFGTGSLSMMTGYTEFFLSVGAMVGCSMLIFFFLFKGEAHNIYFIVLAGMILGNLFSGMSTFMQVLLDPNEFTILQGSMFASFSKINEELFGLCAVIVILLILFTWKDCKQLDVLSLGPDHAINLGVPYKALVLKTMIIISIMISISTVLVGPITFLGILVVSLSREMLRTYQHTKLILGAFLLGCAALTLGLLIVERIFQYSTTVGVIINFVGGVYFIYLMLKESKR